MELAPQSDLIYPEYELGGCLDIANSNFSDLDFISQINQIRTQVINDPFNEIKNPLDLTIHQIGSPVVNDLEYKRISNLTNPNYWVTHKLTLRFLINKNLINDVSIFQIAFNLNDLEIADRYFDKEVRYLLSSYQLNPTTTSQYEWIINNYKSHDHFGLLCNKLLELKDHEFIMYLLQNHNCAYEFLSKWGFYDETTERDYYYHLSFIMTDYLTRNTTIDKDYKLFDLITRFNYFHLYQYLYKQSYESDENHHLYRAIEDACRQDNVDAVIFLRSKIADPNVPYNATLNITCEYGSVNVLKYYYNNNIKFTDSDDVISFISYLLNSGSFNKETEQVIIILVRNHPEIISFEFVKEYCICLDIFINIIDLINFTTEQYENLIEIFANHNKINVIKAIFDKDPAIDVNRIVALKTSIEKNNTELFDYLMSKGAEFTQTTGFHPYSEGSALAQSKEISKLYLDKYITKENAVYDIGVFVTIGFQANIIKLIDEGYNIKVNYLLRDYFSYFSIDQIEHLLAKLKYFNPNDIDIIAIIAQSKLEHLKFIAEQITIKKERLLRYINLSENPDKIMEHSKCITVKDANRKPLIDYLNHLLTTKQYI
jgi:hypothetical protein